MPINTDNFTMEELNKYIKGFKNNKTSGLDNIPIEVGKRGHSICNFLKSATEH